MGKMGAYLRLSVCDHLLSVFFLCDVFILMLCEPVSLFVFCVYMYVCASKSS